MKIIEKYSHLNGEEYLLVHHAKEYREIIKAIEFVNAEECKSKISKESGMQGKKLFAPKILNKKFEEFFYRKNWHEERYSYYLSTDYATVQEIAPLTTQEQKRYLLEHEEKTPLISRKQTDFVKSGIAVEVQFGKYAFVAYDLFVKHLLFYSGGIINVGVEILAMKSLQAEMSSGVAYYEGEVYNILRHGRNNPPVPLVIIGVAP